MGIMVVVTMLAYTSGAQNASEQSAAVELVGTLIATEEDGKIIFSVEVNKKRFRVIVKPNALVDVVPYIGKEVIIRAPLTGQYDYPVIDKRHFHNQAKPMSLQ